MGYAWLMLFPEGMQLTLLELALVLKTDQNLPFNFFLLKKNFFFLNFETALMTIIRKEVKLGCCVSRDAVFPEHFQSEGVCKFPGS